MASIITNEGFNLLLNEFLIGPQTTKYVGLINSTGYSALSATDTAAQINGTNGWDENTSYSESGRQELIVAIASAGATSNTANKASFTMIGTGTVKGAFSVNSSVKAGTSGSTFNEFLFSGGDIAYTDGAVISVEADFTASIC